jgi:hypothetical protein
MMKHLVAVLSLMLTVSASHAQSDPNNLVYPEDANPENWCRNGHFPALTRDYQLGETTRASSMLGDGKETCPSDDPVKCDADKKLEAGVAIAVSKTLGDFHCVFDPRDQSAGWVNVKSISIIPPQGIKASDWLGVWSDGSNRIEITATGDELQVSGNAQWFGATLESGEQVVHEGDLGFAAKPEGNRMALRVTDEYDCAAELIHLGRFLVVRDNGNCGGANVRFNGVYQRR